MRHLVILLANCALLTALADSDIPTVTMPLMATTPTIDGTIHEAEWADAVRNVGFVANDTGRLESRQGTFWVGADKENLYLAILTETAPGGDILSRAPADGNRDIKDAFHDDSIELVLDPKRFRPDGSRVYYHLITNAKGTLYDRSIDPDNKANPSNFSWRLPQWRFQNSIIGDTWHIEIAIPLTALEVEDQDFGRPWGIRLVRNWKRPFSQSQWTSRRTAYTDQATMPLVTWKDDAPIVQIQQLQVADDASKSDIVVTVRNPHAQPVGINAYLQDAWHLDPHKELKRAFDLAPGATELLRLSAPDGGDAGVHHTIITLQDTTSDTTWFHRDFSWSIHRPKDLWTISTETIKAVDLKFKYYPYQHQIRCRVDVSTLDARDTITHAQATLTRLTSDGRPGERVYWPREVELERFAHESIDTIPDLLDGTYRLSLTLKGGEGTPKDPVTQDFVRERFDWEHNRLGYSDQVMPPFTPIRLAGNTVSTVLRDHQQTSTGLWAQVTSQGRELLAQPMHWEITSNGSALPMETSAWEAGEHSDTKLVGNATWQAGALQAAVHTEYDYDGMMLVTLTLPPTEQPIDRLSLIVPMNDNRARYMHAVGDGLRHHFAGATPPGEGRIWDSSQANKIELPGTFYPYLCLSDGEHGIAVFADNSRDWRLDGTTPTFDLTRDGDVLTLRLHLITKPGPILRERRITFGLQATPTKPMPEGWRRWTARNKVPGSRPVSWIANSMVWGGLYYLVYPLGKRFEMFDKLAEARRTGDPQLDFQEQWKGILEQAYPRTDKAFNTNVWNIKYGFSQCANMPFGEHRLFGYTNPRGLNFYEREVRTFQDEWLRYDWFHRNWDPPGAIPYDVSPSDSFVDRAVWYYRHMLTWNDGVYWDNMFLSAHSDPVIGGAWTDDDGRLQPGTGLLQLRNLVKRTAIMHWQASQEPELADHATPYVQLSHMTNTMIVPVLSFGNCTMDWEWHYGDDTFQKRFTPELTVAETIGRQVGAWPTILAGVQNPKADPSFGPIYRSRLGVCLVHELQAFDYQPSEEADLYGRLFAWGYGGSDVAVANYWQDAYPVRTTGQDARTLAMWKNHEALIIVTSYDKSGPIQVTVDLHAIGLPNTVTATDWENGAPIEKSAANTFQLQVSEDDFRILHLK